MNMGVGREGVLESFRVTIVHGILQRSSMVNMIKSAPRSSNVTGIWVMAIVVTVGPRLLPGRLATASIHERIRACLMVHTSIGSDRIARLRLGGPLKFMESQSQWRIG